MVSAAAVATPPTDSRPLPRHVHPLPALVVFVPFWMYVHEFISLHALHVQYALIDMIRRRHIGGHRLTDIDLDELARYLSNKPTQDQTWHHHKRNRLAIGELRRLGLLYDTDLGYQTALSLDHLRLDCRDLEAWMAEKPLNRECLLVPRLMFEQFPRLEKGQMAVSLELLSRCILTGDRTETTAIIALKIGDIAERWGIEPRTVYDVLHRQGLGANVRLEAVDNLSCHRKECGCRYRVVISKGAGNRASTPAGPTPVLIRRTVAPKAVEPEPEPVHQNSDPEPEPVHQNSDFLKVVLLLLLRGGIKTNNPPDAAQNPTTAGETIAAMANDTPPKEKTGFHQPGDECEDQAADLAPLTDLTPATTIAPVQSQDGYHVGDTADDDATADTAPYADIAALEDLDLTATPAVVEALDPVDPAALVANAETTVDDQAGDPARPGADPVDAPVLVTHADDATRRPPAIPAAVVDLPDDGLPRPDWDRLIEADLFAMPRLMVLYEQVIAREVIRRAQSTRLDFVSAAVHARAGRNPPGLFRDSVQKGQWRRITDADEQTARAMLRQYDAPPVWKRHLQAVPKPTGPPPDVSREERPSDVEIVELVCKLLNEQRYRGDYFLRFKATDEGRTWDRARWEAACAKSKIRSQ